MQRPAVPSNYELGKLVSVFGNLRQRGAGEVPVVRACGLLSEREGSGAAGVLGAERVPGVRRVGAVRPMRQLVRPRNENAATRVPEKLPERHSGRVDPIRIVLHDQRKSCRERDWQLRLEHQVLADGRQEVREVGRKRGMLR